MLKSRCEVSKRRENGQTLPACWLVHIITNDEPEHEKSVEYKGQRPVQGEVPAVGGGWHLEGFIQRRNVVHGDDPGPQGEDTGNPEQAAERIHDVNVGVFAHCKARKTHLCQVNVLTRGW